jgi:GLTT repeat-containing protein
MTITTMRVRSSLIAMLLCAGAFGCGPEGAVETVTLETQSAELESLNGLSANGLSANGLSANGLSANGLSANGLSTSAFAAWFSNDPAQGDMVMRYVVRCAVPAGETRSYTNASTGQSYTWNGGLGLAPGWASGAPPTLAEQQVITACLIAHVNRYGLSIPISVLGRDALGTVIPYTHDELETYSVREACFFGNLFTQQGLFFGVDRHVTNESQYLTRACAGMEDAGGNPNTRCAPLVYVGGCSQSCAPDPKGPFYSLCARSGTVYRAITTRMRQSDYDQLFAGLDALAPESMQPRDDPRGKAPTGKKK